MGVPDARGVNIHVSNRGIFMQFSRCIVLIPNCLLAQVATIAVAESLTRQIIALVARYRVLRGGSKSDLACSKLVVVLFNKHLADIQVGYSNSVTIKSISVDPVINQSSREQRECSERNCGIQVS